MPQIMYFLQIIRASIFVTDRVPYARTYPGTFTRTYTYVYTPPWDPGGYIYSCVVIVMESTYCVEAMVRRIYFATLACCSGVKLA